MHRTYLTSDFYDTGKDEFSKFLPPGFGVKKIRRPKRWGKVPWWTRSQRELILYAAGRYAYMRIRVAYLYWRAGWSAREISEQLSEELGQKISQISVESTVLRLRSNFDKIYSK